MESISSFFSYLFPSSFWLPQGAKSWAHLHGEGLPELPPRHCYPHPKYLLYSVPVAFIIYFVRKLIAEPIIRRFGIWLGIKDDQKKLGDGSDYLEKMWIDNNNNTPSEEKIKKLAHDMAISEYKLTRWFKEKRCPRTSTLFKFTEEGWLAIFYNTMTCYGMVMAFTSDWLWDFRSCWKNYPAIPIGPGLFWYYIIQFGFYISLVANLAFGVKRKDFKLLVVHHIATSMLISYSWCGQAIHYGSMVLLCHDPADCILPIAKIAKYSKYSKISASVFITFFVVWLVTRLFMHPMWIYYFYSYTTIDGGGYWGGFVLAVGLHCILCCLNVLWTYFILKVVFKLTNQKAEETNDDRSSDDEDYNEQAEKKEI